MRAKLRPRIQPQAISPLVGETWVIGHRGYPRRAPENTLSSFELAMAHGADMVEFDVTLSRDRVPVVIHDRNLRRTTSGKGVVRKSSYGKISALDAGGWFSPEFLGESVPTLDQVLDVAKGKVAFNVEIKMEAVTRRIRGGIEEQVVSAIRKRRLEKCTVISSFRPLAIRRAKKLAPEISTALLLARAMKGDPRRAIQRIEADALHLPLKGLRREMVLWARSAGIPVRVYTVNHVSDMRKLLTWGVDGIFSDDVEKLRAVLNQRK